MEESDNHDNTLFKEGYTLADISRKPIRPLGIVSDFVVEQLPSELEKIRNGSDVHQFVDLVEQFLDSTNVQDQLTLFGASDYEESTIAQLDLQILQGAIINSGGDIGDMLNCLNTVSASITGRLNSLTYEDLVMTNPKQDIRTFTTGEMGYSEAVFYFKTKSIEETFEYTIKYLNLAREKFQNKDIKNAYHDIRNAGLMLDAATIEMAQFQDMEPSHFLEFREYWRAPADSGLMGVSAYFSHGVKQTDLLFAGKWMGLEYLSSLESELDVGYYTEAEKIIEALKISKENKSIINLLENESMKDDGVLNAALEFSTAMLRFREEHLNNVKNVNLSEGTAGKTSLDTFFEARMKPYRDISSYVQSMLV